MKSNFIHVCFVIDHSGSMMSSTKDVEGGFKRIIQEQKANTEGTCSITLYEFDTYVNCKYLGKDINEIDENYIFKVGGMTALYDGVGKAIDEVGNWLSNMPEEERPEKNLFVIITDGYENTSIEYTSKMIKDRIKHQEEKYNWTFMYLGADITNIKDVKDMGIRSAGYTIKGKLSNTYDVINTMTTSYRTTQGTSTLKNTVLNNVMESALTAMNKEYQEDTGLNMK